MYFKTLFIKSNNFYINIFHSILLKNRKNSLFLSVSSGLIPKNEFVDFSKAIWIFFCILYLNFLFILKNDRNVTNFKCFSEKISYHTHELFR